VQAFSVAGNTVAFSKTFNVTSDAAPEMPVTGVEITDPDPVSWNTKTVSLAWDASSDAQGYRVLARNNQLQTSWVVLFEGAVSQFDRPHVKVTLPDSFDTFPSDDAFSALGFGTQVELAVQAFNGKNDGAFPSKEDFVTLSDSNCPRISVASALGSTDNTLGTEPIRAKYLMTSEGGEPLADLPLPVFTFSVGAGAVGTTLLDRKTMQIRRLRADQFEISFAVPVAASGAADSVEVNVLKVTDTSGNAPDGSLLCPSKVTFISN
jgi:hypothetical protein